MTPLLSPQHLSSAGKVSRGKLANKPPLSHWQFLPGCLGGRPIHAVKRLIRDWVAFLLLPIFDDIVGPGKFMHSLLVKRGELLAFHRSATDQSSCWKGKLGGVDLWVRRQCRLAERSMRMFCLAHQSSRTPLSPLLSSWWPSIHRKVTLMGKARMRWMHSSTRS